MENGPLYSWTFHFLWVWFAWSKTKIATVIKHKKKRTECIGNLLENNYITCLTVWKYLYSDWNMAKCRWHQREEIAWLSVINNSHSYQFNIFLLGRGERWGKWTGLQLRCEICASRRHSPENSQWYSPLISHLCFLFSSDNYKKIAIGGH